MWLNLVFFIAFCGQAISESPGLRTIYMISVFIDVYMLCCTWNIPGWFPTGAGSRIPVAYDKGCPVKFMVFCRQAISESPGLRTMYMISVFIGVYMLCCTWNIPGWFPTGAGSRSLPPMIKVALLICSPPAAAIGSDLFDQKPNTGVCVCQYSVIYIWCYNAECIVSWAGVTADHPYACRRRLTYPFTFDPFFPLFTTHKQSFTLCTIK